MFNEKRLEAMQHLVNDRIQSRQESFVQRLSSLTPILSDSGTNDSASLAAIEEFPQLYDQSEKIAKLQSQLALYQTGLTDQKAPEMHAYEDEARVDSLAALIDNARASRFLDPAVNTPPDIETGSGRTPQRKGVVRQGQTTGKDLTGHGNRRWRGEAAVFREKEYRYTVPLGVSYRRTISLNYCPIQFPPGMDAGDGSVFVKIEICPPGQRHPEVYATSATDEDPASRLAFRVRYQDSAGLDRHFYAKDSNVTPLLRANTFVDILINDVSNEIIAQTPRRWLYLKKGRSIAGLEKFEGGGYTSPTT
ncbi:uncharacterized protein LDX57_009319 [Aspergillus melleus]|uniref:uncharacterized protein n=1 Tax=Aspergillus melleus TaxID=138277 RepID=UPI001E8ECF4D|nr:uncharacterized protein LDX57_009319 [Aspergillus melleus]KAH8431664.1 hypothetical protein LDX57_009319 [Aspergillus melleus]